MKSFLTMFIALSAINTDLYAAEAGMPQLDPKYWASQAFWLILVFAILYISIAKFYLPKIKNNLEDSGNVVGNHYLIELTSILLTIATFRFENDYEEFEYFQNKLRSEIKKQFNNDGTSFEGSSHYAAFVSEASIAPMFVPIALSLYTLTNKITPAPKLGKLLMMAIAIGCMVGAPMSPTGGARNAIMIGFLSNLGSQYEVDFFQWMIMGVFYTVFLGLFFAFL